MLEELDPGGAARERAREGERERDGWRRRASVIHQKDKSVNLGAAELRPGSAPGRSSAFAP